MSSLRSPWLGSTLVLLAVAGVRAQQASTPAPANGAMCRVIGKATGTGIALPGVSVAAEVPGEPTRVTATDVEGRYRLAVPPGTYTLKIDLTGFERVERTVTLNATSCESTQDVVLALAPRGARPAAQAPASALAADAAPAGRGGVGPGGRVGGGGPAAGRGGQGGGQNRFQALEVQADAAGLAAGTLLDASGDTNGAQSQASIPQGFGAEASADAIAVTGEAARVDRGMMNDRFDAIGRGDFAIGALGQGGGGGGFGGGGGGGFGGGGGGRGGFGGGFGRGGQARLNVTADYTFGGSALNSAPYALRGSAPQERPFTQQNFGTTIGGPVKIPGLYDGVGRTTFTVSYNGSLGNNLFDQYATVPTDAMRAGDLSSLSRPIFDPKTGAAFPGNQIPLADMSPQALALLQFFPEPNLGDVGRNYRFLTTTHSTNSNVNVRLTHNFNRPQQDAAGRAGGQGGQAGRAGGQGGFGGGRGAGGGRGRQAQRGTTVSLTTQMQYRTSNGDSANVFTALGGETTSSSIGVPVSLNVMHGRTVHRINVNYSRSTSNSLNHFSNVRNVAGEAGIEGTTTDAFAWGLPSLSFSTLTGLRDLTPSNRSDQRTTFSYAWSRPTAKHSFRAGIDYHWDRSVTNSAATPNGAFVFTGLYSSQGVPGAGSDFADFLLGMPQSASLQYGPGVTMTGRTASLFVQDDWRARGNLTFNVGLRYELLWPYVEAHGRMVNLDVAPGFTAAAPVESSGVGEFTGAFPAGLLSTDTNNLAPRVGVAWRANQSTTVRGGYGISYNSTNYAAIARQLTQQPPFAQTSTTIGALNSMLLMADALESATVGATTNNFGVDKNYVLGLAQTFNVDVTRTIGQGWLTAVNYTHVRGSNLDIVRAPNRGPGGLRIPGVQPFTWQTSEGASGLNSAAFRVQRRPVHGVGATATYTVASSRDNSPSIGGGGGAGVVAQDEQDLNAEWGRSNFDQRQRFSGNVQIELPFGPNRRWLADGGLLAGLLEGWRINTTFSMNSGTPLTPRVQGSSRDVSQGVNGALRANYDGANIAVADQTQDHFFNTDAFSVPLAGAFGTSPRNVIVGPGSKQVDAQFSRDVRLGGARAVTVQIRATNLLNNVNYQAIDTSITSPTFGQVLSVRAMRSAQLSLRFRF